MLINPSSAPYRVEMDCDHAAQTTPSLCKLARVQNGNQIIETKCLMAVHMPEIGKDIHVHQDKVMSYVEQPNNNAGIDQMVHEWQKSNKKIFLTIKHNELQKKMLTLVNDESNIYDRLAENLSQSRRELQHMTKLRQNVELQMQRTLNLLRDR